MSPTSYLTALPRDIPVLQTMKKTCLLQRQALFYNKFVVKSTIIFAFTLPAAWGAT
jgi:hypothetical protein